MEVHERSAIQIVTLTCLVGLIALFACPALADTDEAPGVAELSSDEIFRDIQTLQLFSQLGLTAKQAEQIAGMISPAVDYRAKLHALGEEETVLAVLMQFRAAAATGREIAEEMHEALEQARQAAQPTTVEEDQLTDSRLWRLSQTTAQDITAILTPKQAMILASPYTWQRSNEVLHELAHARNTRPPEWKTWCEERAAALVEGVHNAPAELAKDLLEFFADVRGLTPDAFYEQRPALQARLRDLLLPRYTEDQRSERATNTLMDRVFANPRAPVCLADYAKHLAAPAAGPPAAAAPAAPAAPAPPAPPAAPAGPPGPPGP